MDKRQIFSSNLATLLTMIGVSVGLGNVWRFPYMMGKYGGSAFLLVYLTFTLLFAIPALMAEWALGRETRSGPLGAFSSVFGKTPGFILGSILLITVTIADSYYIVVIANVANTAFFSIFTGFTNANLTDFQLQLSNGWLQYVISMVVLICSLYVVYRGLRKGIESISKIFVPFFTIVIIYLIFYTFSLEGATEQFVQFLSPDFNAINSEVLFAALGQAFFSLGLGGTFILIYGSYLKDRQNIPQGAIIIGLGDMGAAIFASLFIVPAILVYGLDMAAGPKLLFITLPELFAQMPAGRLMGSLFLIALIMVAFLSNIAALEVIAGSFTDFKVPRLSRNRVIIILGAIEMILILPSSLYPDLIGYLDLIFGSGMQMLGSGFAIVALVWGLGRKRAMNQIFKQSKNIWVSLYYYWAKWVVPLALLIILITYIYDSFIL